MKLAGKFGVTEGQPRGRELEDLHSAGRPEDNRFQHLTQVVQAAANARAGRARSSLHLASSLSGSSPLIAAAAAPGANRPAPGTKSRRRFSTKKGQGGKWRRESRLGCAGAPRGPGRSRTVG